ncbi:MAG: ornithine carbamoyltransferase [Magnetospiraceae bacterium]
MTDDLRHFLDICDLSSEELRYILDSAKSLKRGGAERVMSGKTLAMIFEKPSTRTRVSFEVAAQQLGGDTVVLNGEEMQLGRGETLADTARVLSRYVDGIMIRTSDPENLTEMASVSTIPIINGLTNDSHPCQIMADILTFEEHRGPIAGKIVAWSGDANNVANSWIHAAGRLGFQLHVACPASLKPSPKILEWIRQENAPVTLTQDPVEAVSGAHCVVTDTWVSMGDTDAARRRQVLRPYQVDAALMGHAAVDALFMHCLPAHRGEEVTDAVIDGPQSVVWDEAENRMHVQKSILRWSMARH